MKSLYPSKCPALEDSFLESLARTFSRMEHVSPAPVVPVPALSISACAPTPMSAPAATPAPAPMSAAPTPGCTLELVGAPSCDPTPAPAAPVVGGSAAPVSAKMLPLKEVCERIHLVMPM